MDIDLPILWEKHKDYAKIKNAGKMIDWKPETEFIEIEKGIFRHYRSKNSYLASLQDFINYFKFTDNEWTISYKGYFPERMINAIKAFPMAGDLLQMMKSVDILIRRGCPDSEVECIVKEWNIVYEIWPANSFNSGKIILTREINGISESYSCEKE